MKKDAVENLISATMKQITKTGIITPDRKGSGDSIFSCWRGLFFFCIPILFFQSALHCQSGLCGPNVPFFAVNLSGNPNGTWVSNPPMARQGNCCGTQAPDRCMEFQVTLDPSAVAINFQIASGAIPPGALFYQIGCGPQIPVGSPICVSGPGPHTITFCKPGNNLNTYAITSIAGPKVSPADTIGDGCTTSAWVSGLIDSTITWSEITSGTNAYLSYLNCTQDCDSVTIVSQPGYPPYVDYVVCGKPVAICYPSPIWCDTIRVHFMNPIQNTILPQPAWYCANTSGVTLTSNILGGLPPYTVNWKNSAGIVVGTGSSYFASSPGTYSMTVYDATYPKCPAKTSSTTVTIHPVPTVNAGPDKIICATSGTVQLNGAVTNATGGIWTSSGTGVFSPSATALNAVYTASPTDIANGTVTLTLSTTGSGPCAAVSDQMIVTIDPAININVPLPIVCFGKSGSLNANVTGGTAPYFYSWSTGATTQTISNVYPGTYSVTVSDAYLTGCVTTKVVTVTENPKINITTPFNSLVSCDTIVSISVNATGGTGSLSYLWNTGSNSTTINVPTGEYIVTVTDANGCTARDTVGINAANSPLKALVNQPNNLCAGATTTLQASATGGFGSYTYSWNTGASTSSITVGAGIYCATVTDGQGCMNQYCVTVTQSSPLTASIPTPSMICYNTSTTITANATGGKAPYTYTWNTGNSGAALNAVAGNYTVTVSDSNIPACVTTATVTVTQATPLVVTATSTMVSCNGGNTGSCMANVSGSVAPYSYFWPVNSSTQSSAYGLYAGSYTVNVTDAIGCTKSTSVLVIEPPTLAASISSVNNVACAGESNGAATVQASGGVASYSYYWSPSGGSGSTGTGLTAGMYTVTVTDSKGCYTTASTAITQPSPLSGSITGNTPVSCYGGSNGSASVAAAGGNGNYNYYWMETGGSAAYENGLGAGTYNVNITDWAGCMVTTQVVITSPPALTVTVNNVSAATCFGAANGSAMISAAGGTPNYTYYWPSQNFYGSAISGLPAGTYSYNVSDANNCVVTNSITISQPTALTISSVSVTNATCNGTCNGAAAVTAMGGTAPYVYQWNSGQQTASAANLCAGSYSATITDSKGCVTDTLLTITQPPALTLSTSAVAAHCSHPDGTASVSVTGGTPAYYYSWNTSPAQYAATANSLLPGSYVVTVTDSKSCITTATVTVNNTPGVSITSQNFSNTSCSNNCNGSATVGGSGGTGPYTYFWNTSPSQSTATATNLCPGNYQVIISDYHNCKDTTAFIISAPAPVTASVTATSFSICAGDATTMSASATGGTGTFSYNWNNGAYIGQYYTVSPTSTTTYTVTAYDANGCASSPQLVTVNVHPVPVVNAGPDVTVCASSPVIQLNGTITSANGGIWSGGAGTFTPSNTSLNASYNPSAAEIASGQVTLALTSTGSGVCSAVTDYKVVTIAQQFTVNISNGQVCYGQTGALSANVTGGVPPYTYTWSTGATSQSISNVPPGTYFVTVKDAVANGCTASQSGNIYQSPQMFVNLPAYVTSCNTTASVTATGSGGTGALNYVWSTGSTSPTITVPSGNYTVTVYDASGCSVQDNITVNAVIAPISAFTSAPSNLCYGATTSLTGSASGGYGSYSYLWSTGSTAQTITVGAGTYIITATDSAGCNDTAKVIITQSAQMSVSISNPPVICNGSSTTVNAIVSGGSAPYIFAWNTGQTTSSITQPAGTYTVTATDANMPSCSATGTVTITQATPLVVSGSSTQVSCFGGNNGTATANPSGSVGPYTYSWASLIGTSGTVTNLVAGTYQATVTDAIGCVQTMTVAVTQPSAINLSTSSVAAHCNHPDGSATVSAAGGTPAYNYSWNTSPVQFSTSANNLVPGNYVVTVTDNKNCVSTATVTVNNTPGVSIASTSSNNTTCSYNCNGSATVSGAGGTGPYTYFWNTSPVQTTPTASGLCPGNYTIIISDYHGCTDTTIFTIGAPSSVSVTPTVSSNSICEGDGTMLSAAATGGTGTFTYSWNNGAYTGQSYLVSPIVNTTYTVVASDVNGCVSAAQTISVNVHPLPIVNAGANITVCSSAPVTQLNGAVTNATGGIWSGGAGSFIPSATVLNASYSPTAAEIAAGQVTLTLTSTGNGACAAVSDNVTATIAQQFSVTLNNSTVCFGQTGSLTPNVTGGVPPYNYSWSTGATSASVSNLLPGTYSVTVTDAVANGCSSVKSASIIENPQLFINLPAYVTSCNTTATVIASASGGSGALSYMWNTGATASGISVPSGSYTVTVYDSLGCTAQDNITVNAVITPVSAATNQPQNLCNGANTTLNATAAGGYGSFTYYWSTGANTTSISAGAGTYYVIVTDSAGCSDTANVTLTQSLPLTLNISTPPTICNGASTTLTSTVSGGQAPYNYSWSNGQTSSSITATAGTYTLIVSDSNYPTCTVSATGTITQATPLVVNGSFTPVSCNGGNNGTAAATPSGSVGPYTYYWASPVSTANSISNLIAANYQVTVTDSIGCVQTITVTVTEPSAITSTISSSTNVSCYGGSNGSATIVASGGIPNYTYSWSPSGGNNSTGTGMPADSYTVTVTDMNGCVHTNFVSITQPTQLVIASPAVTHVSCNGGNNGSISITASGGTGTYNYYWMPGAMTTSGVSNLSTGIYNVTVTDALGCTAASTITVNEPAALASTIASISDVSCNAGADGAASLAAVGGTPGYSFYWPTLNINGPNVTGLAAGTYNCSVTDLNGCTTASTVTISQPADIVFNVAVGFDASCPGACDGMAIVVPGGGQIPFAYQWSSGQTAPNINNLCAGSYSVTVTDDNGCTEDTVIVVGQPLPVTVSTSSLPANCFHADGSASASASGGASGYVYNWNTSPIQYGPTATGLVPGTYVVIATDNNGCTGSDTIIVANQPGVSASVSNVVNTSCSNVCNGSATASGIGGAAPYNYSWTTTPAQTSQTATTLCPGMYTVTITDNNSCVSTATVAISSPPALTLTPLPSATVICNGQNAVLTASASGGTGNIIYSWNNGTYVGQTYVVNPATTTTYSVVAMDANYCTSVPQTITVTINPALTAIVAPGLNICQGTTANLSASAAGGNGNYSYTWGPGNLTGSEVSVEPPSTMTYSVIISDGCSSDTGFIPVTVYPLPAVNFATNVSTGCAPLCIEFDNNSTSSTGSSIVSWQWHFGDSDSTNQMNPTHCFQTSGIFDVSLTAVTNMGCSNTFAYYDLVQVQPSPNAAFSFSPEVATPSEPNIYFTENATGEISWLWNFGDGVDTCTEQNPVHAYEIDGDYCVTLTVRNEYNCEDTVTHCLKVNPVFTFYIPNAFTPNGNGKNETFTGKGENIAEYSMWIFDRWGDMIFETHDLSLPWDGRANNGKEIAQEDVYVYLVKIVDVFGEKHEYRGHVTIVK